MCGIVGYWQVNGNIDASVAESMAECILHRGPDDCGVWLDKDAGLALGHRRLSIIDLSPSGHQPMLSPCGRYVLIFNGEIYNHLSLRKDLESENAHFKWRGHSDTETLLAALCYFGVEGALSRLNGMFAFAFWDKIEHRLFLARDRLGIKPLYYGHSGGVFLFGSELKALKAHPAWQGEVNREALTLFMRHNYVPSPWSIYKKIHKLPPAHFVVISDYGQSMSKSYPYWHLDQIAQKGTAPKDQPHEFVDELEDLLRDSVQKRMMADVPLGAFLSGGYDSTTVTALMQAQSGRPVKTFSIGFEEDIYNEAKHANTVAQYLGTDHTELYVRPKEAMDVIPELPTIWDEPFSDSSQIPTYLVSKLAAKQVKVSLSGDGGDEQFYGYERYFLGDRIWGKLARLPGTIRQVASKFLTYLPAGALERFVDKLPTRLQIRHFADRIPKLAQIIGTQSAEAFYRELVSHWKNSEDLVLDGHDPETIFTAFRLQPKLPSLREKMMYLDMMTYLPDDILTKVDRASMAVSLEARVPLLDHRVVEFSWRVPTEYKYRDGKTKWLLRQVLYRYVPSELVDRPKMGFGVPIEHWLRGPLRDWAEELLAEKRLREEGFFDPLPILEKWEEHILGKRRWHYYLWDVLMFQAWLAEQ